jgi:hypothetical protein
MLRRSRADLCRPDPGSGECCHERHVRDGSLTTGSGRQLAHFVGASSLHFGLEDLLQKRWRAVAQDLGPQKVLGWESWKTLMSVWAYHSFSGDVEASNTPTIGCLIPHAVTDFRA